VTASNGWRADELSTIDGCGEVDIATRRSDGTYAALATVHTGPQGTWSYRHTYPSVRTYTFRALSAATTRNAANSVTLAVPVS